MVRVVIVLLCVGLGAFLLLRDDEVAPIATAPRPVAPSLRITQSLAAHGRRAGRDVANRSSTSRFAPP